MNATEFAEEAQSGNISVLENAHKIVSEIGKKNKKFAHLNSFDKNYVISQAEQLEREVKKGRKGKLLGIPVSVKDCICVKGLESRAGSKILSGYRPVFDATAVARAKKEGAIILGKTSQDEFGFGTFSVNTAGKIPLNPLDEERSCGGSSGGAAGFTALTENTHIAMAESTGGSIACPASFCGVSSITPTYGLVSRHGLMDYASSLDKIGSMGKTIEEAALLLQVMAGMDGKDSTSLNGVPFAPVDTSKIRIGVPKELMNAIGNGKLKRIVLDRIERARELGAKIEEVSLPLNTEYGVAVYYLIAMAEASTNLAKYCGMRYGLEEKLKGDFNSYFSGVRSSAFGEEAKRRILIGTFARMSGFRDAYYLRSLKTRTKLINEYLGVFKKADLLAFPAMPSIAPRFSEIKKLTPVQHYQMDLCTVSPNLCGLPHATINAGTLEGMPVGLMMVGLPMSESKIISFSSQLEALE